MRYIWRTPRFTALLFVIVTLLSSYLIFHYPAPALAQYPTIELPTGFVQEVVAQKLDGPTSFAFAPDGRIFITQKAGTVRVVENGQLLPENFMDISHEVNQNADRGLMSVAVHPQFPAVPYVYLAYTYEPVEAHGFGDRGARVARVLRISADPANPNVHVPGTGVVIVGQNSLFEHVGNPDQPDKPPFTCERPGGGFIQDCLPIEGPAHTVGQMHFGADGALYVANGDGTVNGAANIRAQDLDSLAGKILRVDPITGAGLPSNPFYNGDPASNRSKVYVFGMRNPFRFTINRANGELWIGEVGNDVWEEISRARAGANLGWPCYEGPNPAATHAACEPLYSGATPVTQAVHAYKHEFGLGAAIGGDFYTGRSFPANYWGQYFFADFNGGLMQTIDPATGAVNFFAKSVIGPVQMTTGPDGHLYWLSIVTGTLYRIRYGTGGDTPPNPVVSASPAVPDSGGTATAARVEIAVGGAPPTARILSPLTETRFRIGDTVSLRGTGTDAEDGELAGSSLRWEAFLHHREHIHYDFYEGSGAEGSFTFADHGDNTYLELCLTATDSNGLTAQDCVNLFPQEVVYTFDTEPSGVLLNYAGSSYTTPFKVVTHVGATRRIGAPRRPARGVFFRGWSDDGARAHEITIGANEQTLVASYRGNLAALADGAANAESAGAPGTEIPVVNAAAIAERPADTATTDTATDTGTGATSAAAPLVVSAQQPAASAPAPSTATTATTPTTSAADSAAFSGGSGRILREWWTGVGGSTISDLTSHADFPFSPTGREFISRFEAPAPFADDYGTRIRGFIYPPTTGGYRFWIASDDNSQLWLSTDDDPANKVQIAGVPSWTLQREWDRHPQQASGFIELEAGKRYYIEALHKEADQKDNLAVAWEIPGQARAVIEGAYLSPHVGQ